MKVKGKQTAVNVIDVDINPQDALRAIKDDLLKEWDVAGKKGWKVGLNRVDEFSVRRLWVATKNHNGAHIFKETVILRYALQYEIDLVIAIKTLQEYFTSREIKKSKNKTEKLPIRWDKK